MEEEVDVAEPIDIDSLDAGLLKDTFSEHEALIVGTPTWNTNADTFRSGTGWDDLCYDKLPELKSMLAGKKVAVFGLGDQISYGENYADAAGELYSVFQDLGCNMVSCAHTSQKGYDHKTSKSILPDTDKFCGLLLDQINQDDLTDDRIANWITQLKLGDFFEKSATFSSSIVDHETEVIADDDEAVVIVDDHKAFSSGTDILNEQVMVLEKSSLSNGILRSSSFIPHHNPVTGRIMWTSPDGRTSFITTNDVLQISN
jgi:flavodoxin I